MAAPSCSEVSGGGKHLPQGLASVAVFPAEARPHHELWGLWVPGLGMKPERPQSCSLHAHVPASNLPVRALPGPAAVLTLWGGGDSSSLVGSCLGRTGSGPCAKLEAGRRGWSASDPARTGKGAAELQGVCPHFLLQRERRGRRGLRSQRRLRKRNLKCDGAPSPSRAGPARCSPIPTWPPACRR